MIERYKRVQEMALRMVDAGLTPVIDDDGVSLCALRGPEEKALLIHIESLIAFPEGFYQRMLEIVDELGPGKKVEDGLGLT